MKTKSNTTPPEGRSVASVLTMADVVFELRAIRAALAAHGAAVLNREGAAAYLGISTATLERLTSAGKLASVRVSEGRVGWLRKALDAYLDALE
jgi:excisionase family DNA binding protein